MSAIVEKLSDAVNDVAATLGNTSISDKPATTDKTAQNDAVLASAAEGRRLYIGNLAYATTEGELQAFFKGYLMYVLVPSSALPFPYEGDGPVALGDTSPETQGCLLVAAPAPFSRSRHKSISCLLCYPLPPILHSRFYMSNSYV